MSVCLCVCVCVSVCLCVYHLNSFEREIVIGTKYSWNRHNYYETLRRKSLTFQCFNYVGWLVGCV